MGVFREGSDSERRAAEWDRDASVVNYATILGGQVGSAALAFVSLWLAARILGAEGYGGIVALIAASQLIGHVTLQWTSIAVFRHGCEEFVNEARIASSFWNRLAILGGNLGLVLLAAPWWLPRVQHWLSIPTYGAGLILAHLVATALAVHVQQSLQAAKLPRFQSFAQLVERGSVAAALIAATLFGPVGFRTIALLYVTSPLISSVVGTWRLRSLIFPRASLDPTLIRTMLRFSYPLFFFSLVGYLTTSHVDAIFILRSLSPAELGVYALAYQVAGVFMQVPGLAGSLVMAFFITAGSSGGDKRIERFFKTTLPTVILAGSILAAVAAAAGSVLLGFFFDPSFDEARALLWPLLAAAALAAPVMAAFGPAANARSRTSIPAIAAAVGGATNIGLNLLLIPRYGLVGCAWATVAAFGVSLLVFAVLVPRVMTAPRSWTLSATLPMVVGAAIAWKLGPAPALVGAFACGAAVSMTHRRDISVCLRSLAALPQLALISLWWKRAQSRGTM